MNELFASEYSPACALELCAIFENSDDTEALKLKRNSVNCPFCKVCVKCATCQQNVSILLSDQFAAVYFANSNFVGDNSELLL
jgi:hypothetical protein